MWTGVSASRLRPWAHLPLSPGITVPLANPRRDIDPSAPRSGLAARCCQTTNPDQDRSGLSADVNALTEVGLGTKFHQPDFFYGAFCFETMKLKPGLTIQMPQPRPETPLSAARETALSSPGKYFQSFDQLLRLPDRV